MKAFYDNKPSNFEAVGNGSYLYRYGITEVEVQGQNGTDDTDTKKTQWQCNEVVVWSPYTANSITEAVIRDKWDGNYEQKLINEYNGAQLGMYGDVSSDEAKAHIKAYTDFLKERYAIKQQIDTDCKALGID